MARRRGRGRGWLWLLAVPLLGIAAYLGFNATLDLLIPDDPFRPPPVRVERSGAGAPPLAAAPPVEAPAPTATAAAQAASERAAALPGTGSAKPAGKRALPRENITERDRRALERVLERAESSRDAR